MVIVLEIRGKKTSVSMVGWIDPSVRAEVFNVLYFFTSFSAFKKYIYGMRR